MATISKAQKVDVKSNICQGDVFQNVQYAYLDSEDDASIQVVEFVFPMAVIVSQACDVISMSDMISKQEGKSTKFMPAILMCPIYDMDDVKKANHLTAAFEELGINRLDNKDDTLLTKEDSKVAGKDWHYRFHNIEVEINNEKVVERAVIDFKHYFAVPASYLIKNRENRLFHLENLFAEQITLKFATYLSRVAIPDE
ncbi:hypothetical protein IKO70_02215 [bacterium]|nr:hypothetical protein [bacterium]